MGVANGLCDGVRNGRGEERGSNAKRCVPDLLPAHRRHGLAPELHLDQRGQPGGFDEALVGWGV